LKSGILQVLIVGQWSVCLVPDDCTGRDQAPRSMV